MSRFEPFRFKESRREESRTRARRRPALPLVLILCATAVLLWVPILALNHGPVWFW